MALQLYTASSTIGVASHIALEESGLTYQTIKIDFAMKEQLSEHYRKINPKMRVPALIAEGQVLTETPAILVYVAQIASSPVMDLPADPLAFAQIQSFNSYLASTVHIAHAHKMRGARWTDRCRCAVPVAGRRWCRYQPIPCGAGPPLPHAETRIGTARIECILNGEAVRT